ncbi:MAG: hypothetical protein NVS3B6_22180 [Pseudarthrobacter sp.]
MGMQPDGDQGLQSAPHSRRIHVRVEAADDAAFLKGADPAVAGCGGDAGGGGDGIVRHPRVGLEQLDDEAVRFVQDRMPTVVRFLQKTSDLF